MDIKLDTFGDMSITGGNIDLVTGLRAIGQDIACRIKTVRGEWILDILNGIPYFEYVWVTNPNRLVLDFLFRQTIKTTAGVKQVGVIGFDFNKANRTMTVKPTVTAFDGGTLTYLDLVINI